MSTAELKNQLHKLIVETDDIDALTKIRAFINKLQKNDSDWWDEINSDDQKSIERGLKDLEDGNTHSDEDVRSAIKERILNAKK